MTSTAHTDLATRLDEVRVMGSIDPSRSKRRKPNSVLTSAVNRACIVLLSAHLEGYLEDVMVEALDALVSSKTDVQNLPLMLRAAHAEEHLRQLEPVKDRNTRASRIDAMFQSDSSLWRGGIPLDATMLRHKAVCGQMDNPGSTQIRQFLGVLNVDIHAYLKSVGKVYLLSQVNGLVARRNAIAHGEVSIGATFGDVDGYMSVVEELAIEIDGQVGEAVRLICSSATLPW